MVGSIVYHQVTRQLIGLLESRCKICGVNLCVTISRTPSLGYRFSPAVILRRGTMMCNTCIQQDGLGTGQRRVPRWRPFMTAPNQ
ncbi:hypothetical protein GGR58DRAFT_59134 [Xylaria digitata]|nr:hypothetical protein GGR58DRAFT_59134 [Xylaria digitata]